MFPPLARLRDVAISCLLLVSVANAREETLFTSSVTYCNPPESLLVQQFDVTYFARNQSVFFNISVASVQPNLNVLASLLVSTYGLRPVNVTLDLCSIFGGALCPLPINNFTGSDTISLPDSLGVADKIPGIAFKIPDLEGFAQLILTESSTGQVKACVQATLSNGWSAHQLAVEWATGGLALAAFLSAAWQSVSPKAMAPYRLLDLLYLYQTIAISSFLSLNYPTVYRAFTLNFAWALGLFSSSSSALQSSIDKMRHLTGGNLPNATSSPAVGLVNRKLSPYSGGGAVDSIVPEISRRMSGLDIGAFANLSSTSLPSVRLSQLTVGGDVQTVTATSSNILQAGIPIYVNSMHIATANAFMTVFLCGLIFIAIALAIAVLGYGLLFIIRRTKLKAYLPFVRAWFLRLGLIVFTPIVVFAFYQWTLKDSWLSVLISVLSFVAVLAGILYPTFRIMYVALRTSAAALYSDSRLLTTAGPLHAQYRIPRYYFFLIMLSAAFLKAISIAFVKSNGEAQIIILVMTEGLVLVAYLVLRPHRSRGGDVFSTFLAVIRLVCTGLLIAFIERLNVKPIPRTVIGIVAAIIYAVTVVVMFLNVVANSGIFRACRRSKRVSPDGSLMEKGSDSNSKEQLPQPGPVEMEPERAWNGPSIEGRELVGYGRGYEDRYDDRYRYRGRPPAPDQYSSESVSEPDHRPFSRNLAGVGVVR